MVAAAGVVLAGGRSRRMGTAKAALTWRGRPLLGHVVDLVAVVCDPVLVVAAAGQQLPGTGAPVLRDAVTDGGPLAGIAVGLAGAAERRADLAVIAAVDQPLLVPAFLARLLALLDDGHDAVVPQIDGQVHPLLAVYRTSLAGAAADLANDAAPVRSLLGLARTRFIGRDDLLADSAVRAMDPGLCSVRGANTPQEYTELRP